MDKLIVVRRANGGANLYVTESVRRRLVDQNSNDANSHVTADGDDVAFKPNTCCI